MKFTPAGAGLFTQKKRPQPWLKASRGKTTCRPKSELGVSFLSVTCCAFLLPEVVNIDQMTATGHAKLSPSPLAPWLLSVMGTYASCAPAFLKRKERAMARRRRIQHKLSLPERLALYARAAREKASLLQPGAEKDELLRKAEQADTAAHLNEWASSHGLQPTK